MAHKHDETTVFPETSQTKTVRRNRWLKDISIGDNQYLCKKIVKLFFNVVERFQGRINDPDTFAPIQQLMSRDKALQLYEACTTDAIRKNMCSEGRYLHHIDVPEDTPTRELLCALWKNPRSNTTFRRHLNAWLIQAEKKLNAWLASHIDPVKTRIDELQRLFVLTEQETDALILEIVLTNGMWPTNDFRKPNAFQKVALHAKLLNMDEAQYLRLIGPDSKLRRLGCFEPSGAFNTDLLTYLAGMDNTPLSSRFYKQNETTPLPWNYFGDLAENDGALLKHMLLSRQPDQGMNILLYGEPGTGKTSFSVALATEAGLTPFFIAQSDEESERSRPNSRTFRYAALQVCAGQVDKEKSILIVDEADALLSCGMETGWSEGLSFGSQTKAADKGRLNNALDTLRMPCIWITNSSAEALDSSNRRRFDFSIRFDALNQEQREAIWRNVLAKHGLDNVLGTDATTQFAARYEISAGDIELALRNLSAMLKASQITSDYSIRVVDRILTQHCKLLNVRADDQTGVQPDYTLDGLNIRGNVSPQQIESAVSRFLHEQANDTARAPDTPRMNLLLSGPSGTGKTEFVKYLGAATRTPVVTRMGSDLLNKYVGGTERNIRQAFELAAAQRAILFLDEAEGLFQSREHAERNWEVTQVNELLHRMENFDGVLICATNYAARLDSATLRRFTFKLAFDYLTTEGNRHFFQSQFARLGVSALTAEEELRLSRIPNLTPGDYRTVRQSMYYLGTDITTDKLLIALERESAAKRGDTATPTIGFNHKRMPT